MGKMTRPIHIVMTPTRNEAWVIWAFLESTTRWADYIIICDQQSTDGTREIVEHFSQLSDDTPDTPTNRLIINNTNNIHRAKVILIDNPNTEFNEAERQHILVNNAREVAAGRDTLLWGLDADEILPANWQQTLDGQHILNSIKGDVFWFRWAQLAHDKKHYGAWNVYYPWLFHDDGKEPHGNYVRNMHSMRIPYPKEEKQLYYVNDFRVLHCGLLDPQRTAAKNRFYQFVDWEINHRNPISLSRSYCQHRIENQPINHDSLLDPESTAFPFDLWSLIELGARHTWFDDYIHDRIKRYPLEQLRKLDIWDEEFLQYYSIEDQRRFVDRIIHYYLHKTENKRHRLPIRIIDKLLKYCYK